MSTSNHNSFHPKYRPDIDGLRAVAVLVVVAFHAFPELLKGGFIGVDVFFVISGYLISTIIFENLDNGSFSFAKFYGRRIRRIFPALLMVMATSFAIGWFFLLTDEFKQLGKHIAAGAAFVSNLVLWQEAGYFDNTADTKPLLHLWSLAVEEQFYIVWPLLLWVAWKYRFNYLFVTLIVIVASFSLNLIDVKKDPVPAFYAPQTRFWELLSGTVLAYLFLYKSKLISNTPKWLMEVLAAVGITIFVIGLFTINKDRSYPGVWALIPVLSAALIIAAGSNAWLNKVVLSNRALVWFGLISFPLYLWHWPLLSFARIVEGGTPSALARTTILLVSVFLAWATYRFIERPLRYGRAANFKIFALMIVMVAVGYAGFQAYSHQGYTHRSVVQSESVNAVAFEWPEDKNKTTYCVEKIKPFISVYCVASQDRPIEVALIGDSHANALHDFVDAYYSQKGKGVIQLGQGGCPPFLGVERDAAGCPKLMNDVVSYVEKTPEITKVFITGRLAAPFTGINFGNPPSANFYSLKSVVDPGLTSRTQIFDAGLQAMVERLLYANKDVTIILDLPELDFDPKSCLKRSSRDDCQISKAIVEQRQAGYRKAVYEIAKSNKIQTVDLMEAFCSKDNCYAKVDGKVLYRDKHHLGTWGTSFLLSKDFKLD